MDNIVPEVEMQEQSPLVDLEPRRQDQNQGRGRAQAQVQARSTILELLENCRKIWGRDTDNDASVCQGRLCDLIDFLMGILRGSRDEQEHEGR